MQDKNYKSTQLMGIKKFFTLIIVIILLLGAFLIFGLVDEIEVECPGAIMEWIGAHEAFDPVDDEIDRRPQEDGAGRLVRVVMTAHGRSIEVLAGLPFRGVEGPVAGISARIFCRFRQSPVQVAHEAVDAKGSRIRFRLHEIEYRVESRVLVP